ncbi:MAG: hypothetical protein JOY80_10495, partial [Candidatus Dormibacteraeota bacterium]|nr:hypothetical protein [Candidatus Dormibacteraeota bacterium]
AWLRRDGGRPGDLLMVTGWLGAAAAGLRCLLHPDAASGMPEQLRDAWRSALVAPRARISEGMQLVAAGIRCGGDISDGLIVDAGRTAVASGCGAELWLDRIPVAPGLVEHFGRGRVELALGGGEDFELLAAASPEQATETLARWPAELAPLAIAGRLVEDDGVRLLASEQGESLPLPASLARHWR